MDRNKSVSDFMNSFLATPEPELDNEYYDCLLYTSLSPRDYAASRMPSSA